jgi:NADP-dependent 3-hydroxy acid dehydrogenase YdfG
MKTNNFNNKVCWITGAFSGTGASMANNVNARGAHFILSAYPKENLETVKAGRSAWPSPATR